MKSEWLDTTLIEGPRLRLFLSKKEFLRVNRKYGLEIPENMFERTCRATCYADVDGKGELFGVVCLVNPDGITQFQIHSLLTHEAVHIFQSFCDHIGEKHPSSEFEAYSIQQLAFNLIISYEDQVKKKKGKKK